MQSNSFILASQYNILLVLLLIGALYFALRTLLSKKEQVSHVSNNLHVLLYLSGIAILLGCCGYFLELSNSNCSEAIFTGSSLVTVICTVTQSAEQTRTISACYSKSAAVIMMGLLTSMISAALWLILKSRSHT